MTPRTVLVAALSLTLSRLACAAAGAPIGPLVMPTATGDHPSVASDAAGNFVIAWNEPIPSHYAGVVRAQRYSGGGAPIGPAFTVSSGILGPRKSALQFNPKVTMDDAGDFAVTWTEYPALGGTRIYVRHFSANGSASGGDFLVDTGDHSDVAMDRDGDTVVAWHSGHTLPVFNGYGFTDVAATSAVHARRFSVTGAPVGLPVTVASRLSAGLPNLGGLDVLGAPAVSLDQSGDFVVVWDILHNYWLQGSSTTTHSVQARRYGADNKPLGQAIQVNDPAEFYSEFGPSRVASDAQGGFVVSWSSGPIAHSPPLAEYARVFDASGMPRTGSFSIQVPPETGPVAELGGEIVSDPAGDFAVATVATSYVGDVRHADTRLRFFSPAGALRAGPVTAISNQSGRSPVIASDAIGNIVVAEQLGGSGGGIVAQRVTGP